MVPSDFFRLITGNSPPMFMATTPHLEVLNSLFVESGVIDPVTGLKVRGVPIGPCGHDGIGGLFAFDEFEFYRRGIIQSLNVCIAGMVGKRKSSLGKWMILVGAIMGYNNLVIDPKGEYDLLADFLEKLLGSEAVHTLEFGPDSKNFLNPIDPSIPEDLQLQLLTSLAITTMGRRVEELDIEQENILRVAIKQAKQVAEEEGRVAVLPDVVTALFEPTEAMAVGVRHTIDHVKHHGRPVGLGLLKLTEGNMVGMLNRETTPGLLTPCPLLVFRCKGLTEDRQAVMISIFNYLAISQRWGNERTQEGFLTNRFHRIFLDEAWDLTKFRSFVDSARAIGKLGGTMGTALWFTMHHITNLERSGGHEAVKDLVPDAGTIIGYMMEADEVLSSVRHLRYTEADLELNEKLQPGQAIWKIGSRYSLKVEHAPPKVFVPLFQTRHLVEGEEKPDLHAVS